MMTTQRFITTLARTTSLCEKHGDVMHCKPEPGSVIDKGYHLQVTIYTATFEDGHVGRFWARGGRVLRIAAGAGK